MSCKLFEKATRFKIGIYLYLYFDLASWNVQIFWLLLEKELGSVRGLKIFSYFKREEVPGLFCYNNYNFPDL